MNLIIFSLNLYFNESQLTSFEAIVECSNTKTVVYGEVASCFFYIYVEEEEENWFHEVRALASISRHRAKSSTRSYKIKCKNKEGKENITWSLKKIIQ